MKSNSNINFTFYYMDVILEYSGFYGHCLVGFQLKERKKISD